MALIELNLEKPALKRTETVADGERTPSDTTTIGEKTTGEVSTSEAETEAESNSGESESGGGLRRLLAVVLGAVASIAVVRQIRKRRGGDDDVDAETIEEDWQTAE